MRDKAEALRGTSFHHQLLDAVGSAVVATDLDGTVHFWNNAAEELFGWSEEEVLGRNIREFCPGCIHTPDEMARALEHRPRDNREGLGRRRDGSTFHASISDSFIQDEVGGVVGWSGTVTDISEDVHVREMAANTARTNQMLMDRSLDVICTFDREGRFVHLGAACERVWGYTARDLLGRSFVDIVQEEDVEKTLDAEGRVRRDGRRIRFENRIVRKDEGIVEMMWTLSWSSNDGLVFGVGRDMTEEKATRRAFMSGLASLKQSERRLRSFVDATAQVVWIADPDGGIINLNDALPELSGKTKEELKGWGWTDLLHPDDRDEVTVAWTNYVRRGQPCHLEYRVRLVDGTYRWLSARVVPVFDDDGALTEWVGTCTDIDEKKKIEAALRASEERYRTIVSTAHEGVWLIDANARTTFVNARMADMLGYGKDEMMGKTFIEFTVDADREKAVSRFAARRDGLSETYEIRFRHCDGRILWMLVSASPFYDHDGSFVGSLGMITDISARKHHEEGLIEARDRAQDLARLKSALLTNLSHELRTPVSAILGISQILVEGASSDMREYADLIETNVARLEETLDSVRDLAALEGTTFRMRPEPFDLAGHLRGVVESFGPKARSKGLYLRLEAQEEPFHATLDRSAFDGVIFKLLSNGVKFTHEGGVTVCLKRDREQIRIDVTDTGIGIGPDFLPNVFDDFEQESDGLTRNYEGSGIGLSIAQRIAHRMGGKIEVRSDRGIGSTFTLYVPDAQELEAHVESA